MGIVEITRLIGIKLQFYKCLSFSRQIFRQMKIGLKNIVVT